MKTLKFKPELVASILSGAKTSTWRMFDDKGLQPGDELQLVNEETGEAFAQAEIIFVREKAIKDIAPEDYEGHETYEGQEEMLATYRGYYGDRVTPDSVLKIVKFNLKKNP